MLQQVLADELALHVAGLGSVGTDEGALVIAADHAVIDFAVEEDDGDAGSAGSLHGVLRSVGRGGLHDVDDQQVGAVGDSGVDLVGLHGLVAAAVVVVGLNAHLAEQAVQCIADAGDVHVGIVIVEHGHVQRAGGLLLGSAAFGLRGAGLVLRSAAGQQAEHHDSGKSESEKLLHHGSSYVNWCGVRDAPPVGLSLFYPTGWKKTIENSSHF